MRSIFRNHIWLSDDGYIVSVNALISLPNGYHRLIQGLESPHNIPYITTLIEAPIGCGCIENPLVLEMSEIDVSAKCITRVSGIHEDEGC